MSTYVDAKFASPLEERQDSYFWQRNSYPPACGRVGSSEPGRVSHWALRNATACCALVFSQCSLSALWCSLFEPQSARSAQRPRATRASSSCEMRSLTDDLPVARGRVTYTPEGDCRRRVVLNLFEEVDANGDSANVVRARYLENTIRKVSNPHRSVPDRQPIGASQRG